TEAGVQNTIADPSAASRSESRKDNAPPAPETADDQVITAREKSGPESAPRQTPAASGQVAPEVEEADSPGAAINATADGLKQIALSEASLIRPEHSRYLVKTGAAIAHPTVKP